MQFTARPEALGTKLNNKSPLMLSAWTQLRLGFHKWVVGVHCTTNCAPDGWKETVSADVYFLISDLRWFNEHLYAAWSSGVNKKDSQPTFRGQSQTDRHFPVCSLSISPAVLLYYNVLFSFIITSWSRFWIGCSCGTEDEGVSKWRFRCYISYIITVLTSVSLSPPLYPGSGLMLIFNI